MLAIFILGVVGGINHRVLFAPEPVKPGVCSDVAPPLPRDRNPDRLERSLEPGATGRTRKLGASTSKRLADRRQAVLYVLSPDGPDLVRTLKASVCLCASAIDSEYTRSWSDVSFAPSELSSAAVAPSTAKRRHSRT